MSIILNLIRDICTVGGRRISRATDLQPVGQQLRDGDSKSIGADCVCARPLARNVTSSSDNAGIWTKAHRRSCPSIGLNNWPFGHLAIWRNELKVPRQNYLTSDRPSILLAPPPPLQGGTLAQAPPGRAYSLRVPKICRLSKPRAGIGVPRHTGWRTFPRSRKIAIGGTSSRLQTLGPDTDTHRNIFACRQYGFYPGTQQFDECMKYARSKRPS